MKKIILLITLVIGLFGNFSCKTKDAGECNECKPLPPDQIVTTKVATIEKTFKVWTGGNDEDVNDSYSVAIESPSSNRAEMLGILAFYNIDAGSVIKDNNLVSIVLYTTGPVDAKSLEKSNVLGAIVYTSTPDQTYIHVFKNAGGEIKLINELSSEIWAITYNDIYSIAAVFGAQSNIVAWQIREFKLQVIKKKTSRSFEHKLNKYLNVSYFNVKDKSKDILWTEQALQSAKRCGHPCRTGKGTCVNPENGDEPFCYPDDDEPTCAVLTMQPGNNDWDDDPRLPFLYDFRDNVLGASAVGAHIQDDFYYCGSIISGKITSTQAMNGFSLIDARILPIVKRLNNASAYRDSSVIFDRSVRNEINAFIADIKTISDDTVFQEILDEVTANVNYCEGKTVAQIKYELTH